MRWTWPAALLIGSLSAQIPQITPLNPHVPSGGTQQFACSQPHIWNLAGYSGGPVYGSITQAGLYTAPSATATEQVVLQCISLAGNGLSGVIITIDPVPPATGCTSVCVGIKSITPVEPVTPPTTSHDSCNPGDWAYDQSFWYVCVKANTWMRSALSAF
jgi:hypothetical protein